MHKTVEEAFARDMEPISKEDKRWWAVLDRLLPKDYRCQENLLRSERIPPFHLIARHALINQFCPEGLGFDAMLQDRHKDCLTRLYLRRRRHSNIRIKEKVDYLGLRSFKLYLDQIPDLKSGIPSYALQVADALAIMQGDQWIDDAADVEFVLGGAPFFTLEPLPAWAQSSAMLPLLICGC